MPAGSYVKRMPWGQQKPALGYPIDRTSAFSRGLVGCWLFNENAGGVVFDLHTNSPCKSWNQTVGWWSPEGIYMSTIQNTPCIAINKPAVFGGNKPISLIISINNRSITSNSPYISQLTEIVLRGNSANYEFILNSFTGATDRVVAGTRSVGVFDTIVATYDTSLKIYQNGVLQGIPVTPTGSYQDISNDWYIGPSSSLALPTPGIISYAMVYDRALSAAEVASLYAEPYCFIEGWNYGRSYSIPSGAYYGSLIGDSALIGNGVLIGGYMQ